MWRRRLLSAGGGKSWLSSTGSKNWHEDKWRKLSGLDGYLEAMLTVSERDGQRKKETMPRFRITHVLVTHAPYPPLPPRSCQQTRWTSPGSTKLIGPCTHLMRPTIKRVVMAPSACFSATITRCGNRTTCAPEIWCIHCRSHYQQRIRLT